MLVEDLVRDFYNRLKRSSERVLVVVHHDVDAVCTAQILVRLFQCDEIMHSMMSVHNIPELASVVSDFKGKVKYIVLINCGASVDLDDVLELDEDQTVFVLDNHRPIHHMNFYSESQIQLLTRLDREELAEIPAHGDIFNEESSDEESDEEGGGKRKRFDDEFLAKRDRKRKFVENRRQVLFDYYEFSSYGSSSALQLYELAWKMSKDTNELLWLAGVGLSELLLNEKIERATYATEINRMLPHVLRLNPETPSNGTEDPARSSRKIHITCGKELILPLYEHWTLWNSLRYSRTVACRFKLWSKGGERGLLNFLVDMGFPLKDVKQSYASLPLPLKKELLQVVGETSKKHRLKDLDIATFIGQFGMSHRFNALDFSLAIQALIDPPFERTQTRSDNFFKALRALSKKSIPQVMKGVNIAKEQLACIFRLTRVILDMQKICVLGPFLHVSISEGLADASSLWCPSWLHLLARFILDANAANVSQKKARARPLVISIPDPQSLDHSFVIGIPPLSQDSPKNLFGQAFQQAIARTKLVAEQDFFDSNVVRLRNADSNRFLDQLVHLLEG